MEIVLFEELASTQRYLTQQIKAKKLNAPVAVRAKKQTQGVGSRDNGWESDEGDLLFSFALSIDSLPLDLPLSSTSIYFAYLMREILDTKPCDKVWFKWPNDIYVKNLKIGGVITQKVGEILICGMGINLTPKVSFGYLDTDKSAQVIFLEYLKAFLNPPSWNDIFSKYRVEFDKNKSVFSHIDGHYIDLKDAILQDDGSLIINNKRVYSLR